MRAARALVSGLCAAAVGAAAAAAEPITIHVPALGMFVDAKTEAPGGFVVDAMRLALEAEGLAPAFSAVPILRVARRAQADPRACAAPTPIGFADDFPPDRRPLVARVLIHAVALADSPIMLSGVDDLRFYRVIAPSGMPTFSQFAAREIPVASVSDLPRGFETLRRGRADIFIVPQLAAFLAGRDLDLEIRPLLVVDEDDLVAACNEAMPEDLMARVRRAFADGIFGEASAPAWAAFGIAGFRASGLAQLRAAQAELTE